jgi:hypothetical protein
VSFLNKKTTTTIQVCFSSFSPSNFMRALSVKPGLVVDPVPGNVVWIYGFWHVEAFIEELFEAGLVELELGIARVIQSEYGVANVA